MAARTSSEADTESLLRTGKNEEAQLPTGPDPFGAFREKGQESFDATGMNYCMAVVMTLVTAAPFFFVVNKLGKLKGDHFIPCTQQPCNYVRYFPDSSLPGTGYSPMQVQNGVARPIALTSIYSDGIMSCLSLNVRTAVYTPTWNGSTEFEDLANMSSDLMTSFLSQHNETRLAFAAGQDELQQTSWILKLAYSICRFPQVIYMAPIMSTGRARNNNTIPLPMGLIPSAVRAGEEAQCESKEVKEKIINSMTSAPSKTVYLGGLAGWCVLKIVHDLMLLSNKFAEDHSLCVGVSSVIFQLIAASAGFAWSASIAGVFISPLTDAGDVVCFYRYPTVAAIFALSTPLLFMYGAFQKVTGLIRSLHYGDYLYYQQFDVPFKYASQSTNWFRGTLVTRVVCGTKAVPDKPSGDLGKRLIGATVVLIFHLLLVACVIVPFACPVLLGVEQAASIKILEPSTGVAERTIAWALLSAPSGCMAFVLCRGCYSTLLHILEEWRRMSAGRLLLLSLMPFLYCAPVLCCAPYPSLSLMKAETLCAGGFFGVLVTLGTATGQRDTAIEFGSLCDQALEEQALKEQRENPLAKDSGDAPSF